MEVESPDTLSSLLDLAEAFYTPHVVQATRQQTLDFNLICKRVFREYLHDCSIILPFIDLYCTLAI